MDEKNNQSQGAGDAMDNWVSQRGKKSSKAVTEVLDQMTGTTDDPLALKRSQAMERFESCARLVIQNPAADESSAVTLRISANLAMAANEWCAAHEFGSKRQDKLFMSHICAELLTGFVIAMSDPAHREKFENLWSRGEGIQYAQIVSEALASYLGTE